MIASSQHHLAEHAPPNEAGALGALADGASALSLLVDVAQALGELAAELLWPTRCAVCDAPDELICESCMKDLPYIDLCQACLRCGAPYGLVQCSECNPIMLEGIGTEALPYQAAASALMLDRRSGAIVSTYKDAGERRLAREMAVIMQRYIAPAWLEGDLALSYIPASRKAISKRGFDHAELLARELALISNLPCEKLLARPRTKDQRKLSRRDRAANMRRAFEAVQLEQVPQRVLLVDDVYTTGASLCAASEALANAGVGEIYCLTFARA